MGGYGKAEKLLAAEFGSSRVSKNEISLKFTGILYLLQFHILPFSQNGILWLPYSGSNQELS